MIRPTSAQRQQWEDEGYLVLEDALSGAQLERLQAAFDRWAREEKPAWLEGIAEGTRPAGFFDIPNAMEKNDIFIDLADHPSYYGLLMDFTDDDLIFLAPQVRLLPPSPSPYVGWHPDVPHTNPLHIKVQIYVEDVGPDQGAFAFVPRSHKPGAGPYPRGGRLESMPGHKVFLARAGTAILFNSYGWHTSMLNKSAKPRKSIILIYEKWSEGKSQDHPFAAIADHIDTPQRRRLFYRER
jgi:hypothetical protein